MDKTKEYYNKNAKIFFNETVNANMKELYREFEFSLNKGDKILDLGCRSGRDSVYFKNKGFEVVSVDYSQELCNLVKIEFNIDVICKDMNDLDYYEEFNGIWASASLLHVNKNEILKILNKIYNFLVKNGVFYLGFKYGNGEQFRNERFFNFYDEKSFDDLIRKTKYTIKKIWMTEDVRPNREEEKWLNAILIK